MSLPLLLLYFSQALLVTTHCPFCAPAAVPLCSAGWPDSDTVRRLRGRRQDSSQLTSWEDVAKDHYHSAPRDRSGVRRQDTQIVMKPHSLRLEIPQGHSFQGSPRRGVWPVPRTTPYLAKHRGTASARYLSCARPPPRAGYQSGHINFIRLPVKQCWTGNFLTTRRGVLLILYSQKQLVPQVTMFFLVVNIVSKA